MMKKFLLFILAATGFATSSIAAKPEPELIKPSGPWNAHYAEESCLLGRTFGTGDDQITFLISRFSPGEQFTLEINGKKIKSGEADSKAKIQFGSSEKEQNVDFVYGNRGKDLRAVFFRGGLRIAGDTDEELKLLENRKKGEFVELAPIGEERKAKVQFVSISGITKRPLILATGSLGKAFAELRKCTDNLVTSWGIDVAKHKKLQQPLKPTVSLDKWIIASDYPRNMLAMGKRSLIHIRMIVDTNGTPTSCNIQQSNRLPEFDILVCKSLMKRAKFTPALDENGLPIISYWTQSVFFNLPS
jgi:TonB family protein